MPEERKAVLLLLARQVALRDGLVWERLNVKARDRALAFAGVLLATVERKAEVRWGKERQNAQME